MTVTSAAVANGAINDNLNNENRAMHGFSIPAYTYKSCTCGKVWIGPAYACIDNNGHFWNCPGCEDRFRETAPQDEKAG